MPDRNCDPLESSDGLHAPSGLLKRLQRWSDRVWRWARSPDHRLGKLSGIIAKYWTSWRAGAAATSEPVALVGLTADTPRCRWESAAILGRNAQRSEQAIAALIEALTDPEEFVRWQAAKALAAQEAGHVFPLLTAALADPEPVRRAGAAEALGYLGGEAAALTLCRHLTDPDPRVRIASSLALRELADPSSVPCLLPLLADESPDVRRVVAGALGRIGDPSTAEPLATALSQPNQPLLVRRALAAALAHASHPDAQPALLAALTDPDSQVRGYAAEALGHTGNEAAYAALAEVRSDESVLLNGTVGDRAKRALIMLERRGRRASS